nr:plasmid segregation protein ParM domain-containing protein [Vibrio coralliilyticus]
MEEDKKVEQNPIPVVAIDDGSTNIKISHIKLSKLITYVCTHSFAEGHKPAPHGKEGFNITIGDNKLHYSNVNSLTTTNNEFQNSDVNLAAIHYALLHAGIGTPEEYPLIDVVVTLPISQYYNYQNGIDLTKNVTNFEAKKKSVLRSVEINNGIEAADQADSNKYQCVTPFKINSVKVMPEGIPAIMSTLYNAEVDDYSESVVVDLGGNSLELCLIIGEFQSLIPQGFDNINVNQVIRAVRDAWGSEQSQSRISHLIQNRKNEALWKATFKNEEKREAVRTAMNEATDKLASQVVEVTKALRSAPNRLYLVGGGSELILPAMTEAFEKDSDVIMIDKPQTALAREIAISQAGDALAEG